MYDWWQMKHTVKVQRKETKAVRKEFLDGGSMELDLKGSVGLKEGR